MGRFVTVFLMWSETVSPINLQTLKSILNFPPQRDLTPFVSPQFAPVANTSGSATETSRIIYILKCSL